MIFKSTPHDRLGSVSSHRIARHRNSWVGVPVALVLYVFANSFTNSRVFFVRDMSALFWPIHRWYGESIREGTSPLWDPYVGFGQPAIGDALRQMLFPPVAALRLSLPDVLGFNLSVVTAVLVAAVGAYLLARRRYCPASSALAASIFALSGPVLSSGNLLNQLWSIALIPWTVWAADRIVQRTTLRRCALLAVFFGLQVLAGEPVTFVSGAVLTLGFVAFGADSSHWRERGTFILSVALAGLVGLGLAAAQLMPLFDTARRSTRGLEGLQDILAVHPLALVEAVVGPVFGDPLAPWTVPQPWLPAMNDGHDPYLFSLYVGVPVILLAVLGVLNGRDRRWRVFWTTTMVLSLLCSLGRFSFVYPVLRATLPFLESFRYPAKFTGIAVIALSLLAAGGWESLKNTRTRACNWRSAVVVSMVLAIAGATVSAVCLVRTDLVTESVTSLARWMNVATPDQAALPVVAAVSSSMRDLLVLSAFAGASIALVARGKTGRFWVGRTALVLLPCLCVFCLIAKNASLNPMLDADLLKVPEWVAVTRTHPSDRVFVPGRIAFSVGKPYERGITRRSEPPSEMSRVAVEAIMGEAFNVFPGVSRAREGVSIDVTQLWSREYMKGMRFFAWNPESRRALFLDRTATRFVIAREKPTPDAAVLYEFRDYTFQLYELARPLPRAFVVASSTVIPNADVQTERLFDPAFDPRSTVMLEKEAPDAVGLPAAPAGVLGAELLVDESTSVTIGASIVESDGFVVLHDTWDPNWTATVDGLPAEVLRANGLFRAVRVVSGEHVVRFVYRPTPFYTGLVVSGVTSLLLVIICASRLGMWPLYTPPHGQEAV